jgi:hypothetical protein
MSTARNTILASLSNEFSRLNVGLATCDENHALLHLVAIRLPGDLTDSKAAHHCGGVDARAKLATSARLTTHGFPPLPNDERQND